MNFRIVAVKVEEDVKFCSKLLENSWKKWKQNALMRQYSCDQAFFYVVKKDETVIGFLYAHIVSVSSELMYHSTAVLKWLMVGLQYRYQGFGTLLIEVFLEFCYHHNIKILETEEFHENEFMRKLYWRLNIPKYSYQMNFDFGEENV